MAARALEFGILAVLVTGGIACGLHPPRPRSALAQVPATATPPVLVKRTSDPAALTVWKRTLLAQERTPLRARALVTLPATDRNPERKQTVSVFEGTGGKYRLEYQAPTNVAGRIVVCDGKQVYHYEPSRATAIQQPRPPYQDPLLEPTDTAMAMGGVSLLPGTVAVDGRPTQVLEFRSPTDGGLREKRWVDVQTGRSLQTEQYSAGGKLVRRTQLTQVVLPYNAPADLFRPAFPHNVRIIATRADRVSNAEKEAAEQGLPARSGAFRARTVVRPKGVSGTTHQFIFSDGIHALSIFVSPGVDVLAKPQGKGWNPVTLSNGLTGYATGADGSGRAAVAWLRNGRRYVAVARLSMPHMLRIVRDLTAEQEG